tara:strand:- start:848 stop:1981 length:1134 start_codon:yes stop_codon:yes gene_type:complete
MYNAGIYIHIPFCAVKCMYCDFYSITDREESINRFINAITKEIERCSIDTSKWEFETIFIGGGTPSLLNGNQLESIISALDKKYNLSNIIEFTLETNPGEAPMDHLKAYKSLGVNRLSIGVQSLQSKLLKFLTRIHNRKQVFETYNNARKVGFQNINCDLIYSIPGQTLEMWEKDLNEIYNINPEHISAYSLTVEKGTELFKMVKKNTIVMPNDHISAKWFKETHNKMNLNGYEPYEISNFSKPKYQCKHNIHYWRIDPYLAFGPSANGFDLQYRWNNICNLDSYINKIEQKKSPIANIEKLTHVNRINEFIGFGLRMIKGFDLDQIPNDFKIQLENNYANAKNKYDGCFKILNNNISLSKKGLLLADEIIPHMLLQ